MKVIKHPPKQKDQKATCHKCKAELEYTFTDIQSDRDGRYIVCPCCQSFIAI